MAFVGISGSLCTEVRSKIRTMRDKEIVYTVGEFQTRAPISVTGNESWFVKKVWQNKMHLISEMPSEWLANKFEAIDFHFSGPGFTLTCRSTDPLKLPPMYRNNYPDVYVTFQEGEEMPLSVINEHIQKAKQRTEITDRWKKIENQVNQFLENCKSLNEAIKLWPDLKLYIPAEYIERLERKAAKAEKVQSNAAAVLAGINTEEIQAAAVIARISGAGV